ncbi:hypothetical protein BAOM_4597 [Peribacillus asahii]|uniref:Uncharacterized protein n=1 Tax=Peribacillus asahii TaxID=228899 RepID=A0A3Q9RRH6_9BACI|nr:hypothetical protein [Peribacillus asahii]AZV45176.1 hypothetical protein BAOM_4597 [Peribacillus asahii]
MQIVTYLIVTNVERVDVTDFIVANIYDDTGQLIDQTIQLFKGYKAAIDLIRSEMYVINQPHFEVWTSDKQLYVDLLAVPGVAVSLKHSDQTQDTRRAIKQEADLLREIYELVPVEPLPKLPKWRKWLYSKLLKITQLIGGNGKYDNQI